MHLVRTEFSVRAGGAGELEASTVALGEMRKGQPGYLGQTLLRSYSYPGKYVVTSRWDNVEAAWAFSKSEVLANYAKGLTGAPFSVAHQEGYEGVFEVDAEGGPAGQSGCEVLVDWDLDQRPGVIPAFERSRHALAELWKNHTKGFASNRLRRSGGKPFRYLILSIYATAGDAMAAPMAPEVQAFMAAHPYRLYAAVPPSIEAYAVVHRIGA